MGGAWKFTSCFFEKISFCFCKEREVHLLKAIINWVVGHCPVRLPDSRSDTCPVLFGLGAWIQAWVFFASVSDRLYPSDLRCLWLVSWLPWLTYLPSYRLFIPSGICKKWKAKWNDHRGSGTDRTPGDKIYRIPLWNKSCSDLSLITSALTGRSGQLLELILFGRFFQKSCYDNSRLSSVVLLFFFPPWSHGWGSCQKSQCNLFDTFI